MSLYEKKVLLLFSGGRDSFLAACKLIEEGYYVYMIHYDNGCSMGVENPKGMAQRIIDVYGDDKATYLGSKSIAGFWRRFFRPIMNMTPNEISQEYGQLTMSQFNCLTCRTSMYIFSIILCKNMNIEYVAEGARRDQGFVVELESMIERYTKLLKKNGINLLLPVYNFTDDWERKNELLSRGFLPKTYESQCLIGVPLAKNEKTEEVINATVCFYDKFMIKIIDKLIQENEKILIDFGEKIYGR